MPGRLPRRICLLDAIEDVANGYARNFLLPKNWLLVHTTTTSKLSQHIAAEQRKIEEQSHQTRQQASAWPDYPDIQSTCGRPRKTLWVNHEPGYRCWLRESEGIQIDPRMIDLPDPIRALGTYHVPIKIAQKLAPEITVNVVDESSSSYRSNRCE